VRNEWPCESRGHAIALIDKPLRQVTIRVNAPVTEEGPMAACGVHFGKVHGNDERLLSFGAGFVDDLPGRVGDKALAPELNAIAVQGPLKSHAVRHGDIATIRHAMAALDQFPRTMLAFSVFGFFLRM